MLCMLKLKFKLEGGGNALRETKSDKIFVARGYLPAPFDGFILKVSPEIWLH